MSLSKGDLVPVDQASLYGGYAKASRPKLPKPVIEGGLKLYGITMAEAKGKTDAQLRRMAAKAVIARRRSQMAKTMGTP